MKTSNNGLVVQYEEKDYPHLSFSEIISGMEASNKRRHFPAPAFTCFCEVCPERPGFTSTDSLMEHNRTKIEHHRKIMGKDGKK